MLPTLGARSFAAALPPLWDKLPSDITKVAPLNSFKKLSPFFSTNHLKFILSPFNIMFNFGWNFCKALLITSGKSAIEMLKFISYFFYMSASYRLLKPAANDRENVFVLTNGFSKFPIAVTTRTVPVGKLFFTSIHPTAKLRSKTSEP